MDRSKVAIIIPAYNEEDTIAKVVSAVSKYGIPIVVDDFSADGTSLKASEAGAVVIRHEKNSGYDGALNSGFRKASQLNCEYAITMDGDAQHDPRLIETYLSLLKDSVDMVCGIRPRKARIAETVFSWVARFFYGIKDPMCGMKGYRLALFEELGHFDSYGSIGTELALFAAEKKYRFRQLPVPILERKDGSPRFGQAVRANLKILLALRGFLIRKIRGQIVP